MLYNKKTEGVLDVNIYWVNFDIILCLLNELLVFGNKHFIYKAKLTKQKSCKSGFWWGNILM